jgi:hypothetical protein
MTSFEHANHNRQSEILKKRLSNIILKENSKGLSSHEAYIKRAAIRQLVEMNHQYHR